MAKRFFFHIGYEVEIIWSINFFPICLRRGKKRIFRILFLSFFGQGYEDRGEAENLSFLIESFFSFQRHLKLEKKFFFVIFEIQNCSANFVQNRFWDFQGPKNLNFGPKSTVFSPKIIFRDFYRQINLNFGRKSSVFSLKIVLKTSKAREIQISVKNRQFSFSK